jgi:outer membrane protein OmpA-like peptidoglycan-associated protein
MNTQTVFDILPPASLRAHRLGARQPAEALGLAIKVLPFVVLDRFAFDSSVVPTAHDNIIERIARLLVHSRVSGDPIDTARLVGHADSTGNALYNLGLAERRAKAVDLKLRAAIAGLGAVPAGTLNIVPQTLGETKGVASNATADGRARNRRVSVFLPITCNTFFAQYDLRFMPGDPVFGIEAHPNIADKKQRTDDVNAVVGRLLARRDLRAGEALAGRVPPPRPLAPGALRNSALRLSSGQLAMFREYFPGSAGGIDFDPIHNCFMRFANGELRSPVADEQTLGVGEPNGGFFFLFAEFALLCIDSGIDAALWTRALRSFAAAQEVFMHVYRPAPTSPPPAVGAALPACPPAAAPPLTFDDYDNSNFTSLGGSPTVGAGQSNAARKTALRARYDAVDLTGLKHLIRANMQRTQCMP